MEGDCCEGDVLDFFFYLLPRNPEPSLHKTFPGYSIANNPNCKLGKTCKSVFFDITYTQRAYRLKLKMKCCDWIKQIKHIYLVMDMCDEGKNKMNMSPKVEKMKEYLEFIRSFSCKKDQTVVESIFKSCIVVELF